MSNPNFPVTKRIALAFSGLVFIAGAPYVVAEGLPFIALWTVVGFGLLRQMILAIAPSGFRHSFPWPTVKVQKRNAVDRASMTHPIAAPEAA